jgi:hypothetical protein
MQILNPKFGNKSNLVVGSWIVKTIRLKRNIAKAKQH